MSPAGPTTIESSKEFQNKFHLWLLGYGSASTGFESSLTFSRLKHGEQERLRMVLSFHFSLGVVLVLLAMGPVVPGAQVSITTP